MTCDFRNLAWCFIDDYKSLDPDQLTVVEAMPEGAAKFVVAIADVEPVAKKQAAIDDHAKQGTASVYTAAQVFPMMPEKLSIELTFLNFESDRLCAEIQRIEEPNMARCTMATRAARERSAGGRIARIETADKLTDRRLTANARRGFPRNLGGIF